MKTYIQPSETQGKEFFNAFKEKGEFVMLNLLRFKDSVTCFEKNMSGEESYQLYLERISPELKKIGSEVLFKGKPNGFLVGPTDEKWDLMLLVKHQSVAQFLAFSQNKVYLENAKYQVEAIGDFRLLPVLED